MKITKARVTPGFTYREGVGIMPVVDVTPNNKYPTHKVLWSAPRMFAPNEQVTVILSGEQAVYYEPAPVVPRVRPPYVAIRKAPRS